MVTHMQHASLLRQRGREGRARPRGPASRTEPSPDRRRRGRDLPRRDRAGRPGATCVGFNIHRTPVGSGVVGRHRGHERRSTVPHRHPGGPARRPEATSARDALARRGNARRLVAGHTSRLRAGGLRVLGRTLRLARDRSATQSLPAVHDRHRRRRHPWPARAEPAAGRPARRDHARMARLRRRVPQGDRAARGPDCARRQRGGRVPRRLPVAAGLRVLRKADAAGMGRRKDRRGVGRAHDPARLRALGRAGWRLGIGRHDGDRHPGSRPLHRHPPQHAERRRSPGSDESHRARAPCARRLTALSRMGLRLLEAAIDEAANGRLRARGLAGGTGRMDPGEILGMDRLQRPSRERSSVATSSSTT